jgi:16S rRNA (guanine966-N2)-methyltransferase
MRVTGGEVKGNRLKVPESHLVRPTTDLVRKAIFSILENTAPRWCRVLDLYAGSGALGIEALSRKAEWVDFVDQRQKCCITIKYNLERAGLSSRAHIYCCSARKAISFLNNDYDVILIDPPYSDRSIPNLLTTLTSSKLIAGNSTIVVCHANRFPLSPTYNGLNLIKQRHYGDTFISIYQKEI